MNQIAVISLKIYKISKRSFLTLRHNRSIFSQTGKWEPELTVEVKKAIENHWKASCVQQLTYSAEDEKSRPKYYVLAMFPYPSGNLHMGHVRVYTISDAIARFYHMKGYRVIHPMGWDAFGLPAENAARERGIHPAAWTKQNIAQMKQQLQEFCCTFDWNKEIATCDPTYYKWTQYIFLKMFEKGLAYQKEAYVNWDPVDETVLADEQVDEEGRSWRSGAKVEKKLLKQWFLKATQFSKELSEGLDDPVLENWRDVKKIQKHWIGDCGGTHFTFQLLKNGDPLNNSLTVWTDKPQAVFGATFLVLSPHNLLATPYTSSSSTHNVKLPLEAVHPFTKQSIPIFLSRTFTFLEGTDAHLGIPCLNEKDNEFAVENEIARVEVVDNGRLINSQQFSNLEVEEGRRQICSYAQEKQFGGFATASRLKDWLISRQRFWGTPIPIIHCGKCGPVAVPVSSLPIQLPIEFDECSSKSGQTKMLKNLNEWLHTTCPRCEGAAERETDTMDTFVDSSWYFLRFLDARNERQAFDQQQVAQNMPVDIYIGGKEHAVMHLYYARFVNRFLHSLGLTPHPEPFKRLLVQGMVLGQTFLHKQTGRYLKKEEVQQIGDNFVTKEGNEEVISQWEKMSKSRHNGVNPQEVVDNYGVDTTRMLMLANFAPTSDRNWPASTFPGILGWQNRLWLTLNDFISARQKPPAAAAAENSLSPEQLKPFEEQLIDCRNFYLRHITHNFHSTFQLSVAISNMQGLTSCLRRMPAAVLGQSAEYERALAVLIITLAPIVPNFASELWAAFVHHSSHFKWDGDVLQQRWPTIDSNFPLELVAKINDVEVHSVKLPREEVNGMSKERAVQLLMCEAAVSELVPASKLKATHYSLYPDYEAQVHFIVPGVRLKKKKKQ